MGRRYKTLSASTAALLVLGMPGCVATNSTRPPKYDPNHLADYLVWYKSRLPHDGRRNAAEKYEPLNQLVNGEWSFTHVPSDIESEFQHCQAEPWDEKDHPRIVEFLEQRSGTLALYASASLIPDCWEMPDENAWSISSTKLSLLVPLRFASQLLICDSMRIGPNQQARIIDNGEIALRLARHLNQSLNFLQRLSAHSIRSKVWRMWRKAAQDDVIDPIHIGRALRAVLLYPPCPQFDQLPIEIEWAMVLEAIPLAYKNGSLITYGEAIEPGFLLFDGKYSYKYLERIPELASLRDPSPNVAAEYFDETYAHLIALTRGRPALETFLRINDYAMHLSARTADSLLGPSHVSIMASTYRAWLREITECRATLITMSISQAYRFSELPDQLREFHLPEEWTTDPFSGNMFAYQSNEEGFRLYSIGFDGQDNGGRHDLNWGESEGGGDFVFWPVQDQKKTTTRPRDN